MHELVPLSKIVANPFRKLGEYDIEKEKIEALKGSMERTGFWENVVARKRGDVYELAYGHHRWEAFKEKFGEKASMNLIVRDIDDDDMLRIMADENMNEFDHSVKVANATIEAVVNAYADGKIKLNAPNERNGKGIRFAPKFVILSPEKRKEKQTQGLGLFPYNAETIADFLKWRQPGGQVKPVILNALAALEEVESGRMKKEEIEHLSPEHVNEIALGARKIERFHKGLAKNTPSKKEAKAIRKEGKKRRDKFVKDMTAKSRKSDKDKLSLREIRAEVDKAKFETNGKAKKELPTLEEFCRKKCAELMQFVVAKHWAAFDKLIEIKDEIDPDLKLQLITALGECAKHCLKTRSLLRGNRSRNFKKEVKL
jgi:ParB-like chromosome segregation protein Spo0J